MNAINSMQLELNRRLTRLLPVRVGDQMEPKCILRVHSHCRRQTATAVDCRDDSRRLWLDDRGTDSDGSFAEASGSPVDSRRVASGMEASANFVDSNFDCSSLVVSVAVVKILMVPGGFGLVTAIESVDDGRESETKSLRIH
jgi:hypothetical protein